MNLLKEGQVDSSYCLLLCSAAKKNPQTMKSLVFILTLAIVVGETLAVEGLDFGDSFQFAIETRRDFNENCQGTVELRSRNDLLELSPDNHPKIERSHRRNVDVVIVGTCCFELFSKPYFRGSRELYLPGQTGSLRRLGSVTKVACPLANSK